MHRFSHFISNEAWRPNCEGYSNGLVGSEAARHDWSGTGDRRWHDGRRATSDGATESNNTSRSSPRLDTDPIILETWMVPEPPLIGRVLRECHVAAHNDLPLSKSPIGPRMANSLMRRFGKSLAKRRGLGGFGGRHGSDGAVEHLSSAQGRARASAPRSVHFSRGCAASLPREGRGAAGRPSPRQCRHGR